MQEWHELLYKDKSYKIEIIRKNISRLNLKIKADSRVSISAPYLVSRHQIEAFLLSKASWIAVNVAKMNAKIQVIKAEDFSPENKQVTFLGNNLIIEIQIGRSNSARLYNEGIVLQINSPESAQVQKVLEKFLRQKLHAVINNFIQGVIAKYPEFPKADISLRKMRSRWGSCSPNKNIVTLNSYLIYAPLCCIEYILMHEFVHFLCRGHSAAFYERLAHYMPDWKQRKHLLDCYAII